MNLKPICQRAGRYVEWCHDKVWLLHVVFWLPWAVAGGLGRYFQGSGATLMGDCVASKHYVQLSNLVGVVFFVVVVVGVRVGVGSVPWCLWVVVGAYGIIVVDVVFGVVGDV